MEKSLYTIIAMRHGKYAVVEENIESLALINSKVENYRQNDERFKNKPIFIRGVRSSLVNKMEDCLTIGQLLVLPN